ncbi:hypothetical protein AOXY_G25137 [Acipenser oxyrinchus oxyrinchus]|uniref:Uncharacterized protein n=1 Tax=Acipenser oxyrinchus oxyrinchus TaxID=40147 RepID=A0AAD8CVE4_ACIOX|nr:hypothetical protein AOXY_G25137 [Acipenser oxyrinchus oxyrinchus]
MDDISATPHWIINARKNIEHSQQWKGFTAELFDAVQQQLVESHVNFFTDLSEAEKTLFLRELLKLCRGNAYKEVVLQISSCLEDQLSSCVAIEMQESGSVSTRSERFQSHVRDGMVNLLHKWPDMKYKLHALFNQPLSSEIRKVAWRLFLSNTKARMEYLTRVSKNTAKFSIDLDISMKCDTLLSTEPTFKHLRDSKIATRAMKNVLTYYHRIQRLKNSLPDTEYSLLVPLVQAAIAGAAHSTSVATVTTLLVEEYITLMESRPPFMRNSEIRHKAPANTEGVVVFEEVVQMLGQKDKELSNVIQKIYTQQGDEPGESLCRGVENILQAALGVLFVGYLNMTTLLYIWDQYVIGLDKPSYDCTPAFSFAFLHLLRDHLQKCNTKDELAAALRSQGALLTVGQFQSVISKYFYGDLYSTLTKDNAESFPVLDPTQSKDSSCIVDVVTVPVPLLFLIHSIFLALFPPWTHLSSNENPLRTRPKDRRQAREEREALRMNHIEKMKQEERHRKLREEEEIRLEEERLQRQLEETKRINNEQRLYLEEQLAEERQHRYDIQKNAEEQIGLLQAEIRKIKGDRRPSVDIFTVNSFGTPPPSIESKSPVQDRQLPPLTQQNTTQDNTALPGSMSKPRQINGRTAESVTQDLLQRIMLTADTIINGQNTEREELNSVTRDHLYSYRQDVQNAELEVFGRYLDPEELKNMPEPSRTEKKRRLAAAIKRGVEARYRAKVTQERLLLAESVAYMGATVT